MGDLPSLSEVVHAVVFCQPGDDFLFPLIFVMCCLKVCLEVRTGFSGAFFIVPLVTVIVK